MIIANKNNKNNKVLQKNKIKINQTYQVLKKLLNSHQQILQLLTISKEIKTKEDMFRDQTLY